MSLQFQRAVVDYLNSDGSNRPNKAKTRARRIRAAAPELYAALTNLLMRSRKELANGMTPYGHCCSWCQTCYYRAEDDADAALAKARGAQ